jgi:hypothetical protein
LQVPKASRLFQPLLHLRRIPSHGKQPCELAWHQEVLRPTPPLEYPPLAAYPPDHFLERTRGTNGVSAAMFSAAAESAPKSSGHRSSYFLTRSRTKRRGSLLRNLPARLLYYNRPPMVVWGAKVLLSGVALPLPLDRLVGISAVSSFHYR